MRAGYIVILLILAALPYCTALHQPFVYDDHGSIAENAFLSDPANFRSVLAGRTILDQTVPDGRRPLVVLTYFVDRALWRLNPFGYHLTNLLLHLAVVVFLVVLLRRLFPEDPFFTYAAALLFSLHPVLAEAVHVPAFREDLLFTLFTLVYLVLALARGPAVWLSLPALALALLSKEGAVVAPLILVWVWICFPDTRPSRRTRPALVGLSLLLAVVFIGLWARTGPLEARPDEGVGLALVFPANLFTAPWLWFKGLRLLLWPYPLVVDYVIDPAAQWSDVRCQAGLAALVVWLIAIAALLRRRNRLAFGLGWMLIGFLPVSNLIPLHNPFAERYLYFIAIGFALVAAGLVAMIPRRTTRPVVLAALCAACTGLLLLRLADWKDDLTLWSSAAHYQPRSARALTWMGLELKKRGQFEQAFDCFAKADELNTNDVSALINIGVILGQQGALAEAVDALQESIRRRPGKADAHWNLAVAFYNQGLTNEAMAELEKTLEIDPRYGPALETKRMAGSLFGPPPSSTTNGP